MMKLSYQQQYSGQEWYPDSAATAHITNNGSQLQYSEPYFGNDQIIVENGEYLPIKHGLAVVNKLTTKKAKR